MKLSGDDVRRLKKACDRQTGELIIKEFKTPLSATELRDLEEYHRLFEALEDLYTRMIKEKKAAEIKLM